jgi:hypothetical protein
MDGLVDAWIVGRSRNPEGANEPASAAGGTGASARLTGTPLAAGATAAPVHRAKWLRKGLIIGKCYSRLANAEQFGIAAAGDLLLKTVHQLEQAILK